MIDQYDDEKAASEVTDNWGDVVTPRSADDQTCEGVLDCLQTSHQAIDDSEQEAVAVVQP